MAEFTRFAETITVKEDMRVVSITVKPIVSDCTGRIWFTDLMVQEGDRLTGFAINTETLLQKYREEDAIVAPRFYNGIDRSSGMVVIFNLGSTTAGLDIQVEPIQDMADGSIVLSQGAGSHKATFLEAATAGDTFALLASSRECLKNGAATSKDGFFQYSAAGDSKHPITLENGKSAKLYIEFLLRCETTQTVQRTLSFPSWCALWRNIRGVLVWTLTLSVAANMKTVQLPMRCFGISMLQSRLMTPENWSTCVYRV